MLAKGGLAQPRPFLKENAATIFNEIITATKNGDHLWNKNVYGPILLVDPKTREVFANQADTAGILKPNGNVFSGILPATINIANTASIMKKNLRVSLILSSYFGELVLIRR